ncbi:hypothetical protein NC653_036340 [Populus alba x Populus x berolinensis]|uniref:Uncharacterized protein n=1 Tax=Populus alba x Populus x berolinensis TaxID=444605 RepID=A0AAD6LJM3_9ROSI|nr:hypothetical protein NC653_036340 [Populus alba x Populus x berolinensis]
MKFAYWIIRWCLSWSSLWINQL